MCKIQAFLLNKFIIIIIIIIIKHYYKMLWRQWNKVTG